MSLRWAVLGWAGHVLGSAGLTMGLFAVTMDFDWIGHRWADMIWSWAALPGNRLDMIWAGVAMG